MELVESHRLIVVLDVTLPSAVLSGERAHVFVRCARNH